MQIQPKADARRPHGHRGTRRLDQFEQLFPTDGAKLLLVLVGFTAVMCALWAAGRFLDYLRKRDDAHLRDLARRQLDFAARTAHRERFFGAVLDELRSPIGHFARSIEETTARCNGCEQARGLAATSVEADRLWRLSTRLAELVAVAAAAEHRVPADFTQAARAAIERVRPTANERRIHFTLDAPRPVTCRLSLEAIRDALVELLMNALHVSVEGGHVEVRVRTDEQRVRAEVEDFGPGVPAAQAEALFDPFARKARGKMGEGLGLAIAREAARAHGGDVYFAPSAKAGARVVLEIPVMR